MMVYGYPLTYAAGALLAVGVLLLVSVLGVRLYRADDPRREADAIGRATGNKLAWSVALVWRIPQTILSQFTYMISRVIPFFGTLWWKAVAKLSLYRYHKKAGGDAIALAGNEQSGKVRLEPVKWDDGLEELDEKPGWKMKGNDRFFADSNHGGVVRLGKTPLLPINEDERRAGSWLECNVTEAIDDGHTTELYEVESADLRATLDYSGGGQPALSDGGQAVTNVEFEPRDSPVFKDVLVDLTSDDVFDGRAISWWKYSNFDPTKTSPEAIDQAEERGRLAGLAGKDTKGLLIKLLLIAGGIAIGLVAATHLPTILDMLMGGGGGGGGGGGAAGGFLTIFGPWLGVA